MAQSLLWLIAYFWHFTRPALAILLDPDLKSDVAKLCRASNSDYTNIELREPPPQPLRPQQQQQQNATTLLIPLTTTTTTTASFKECEKMDSSSVVSLLHHPQDAEIC